jgi:hypothetical protein
MKNTTKKLSLKPQTLRALSSQPLGAVAGGRMPETRWTYCGQGGPTECYKPNPY